MSALRPDRCARTTCNHIHYEFKLVSSGRSSGSRRDAHAGVAAFTAALLITAAANGDPGFGSGLRQRSQKEEATASAIITQTATCSQHSRILAQCHGQLNSTHGSTWSTGSRPPIQIRRFCAHHGQGGRASVSMHRRLSGVVPVYAVPDQDVCDP